MAKVLKTSVKLDANQAIKTLERLEKRINAVQSATNKVGGNTNRLNNSFRKSENTIRRVANGVRQVDSCNKQAAISANSIAKGYNKSNSAVRLLTKNVRALVSAYVGLQGVRALVNQSDVITASRNKLNNANANQLGDAGYVNGDVSQGYSKATLQATQDQMDKMYVSAQKVRMGYNDMMANVSKSMILAGDSFQNNTDNAIRFQEIMSEAYTLGGASAAEMSSSMYQMIQALGSGQLSGDELRSVREGAPLAYKAIEEFAQGVLNTNESLKDLASEGKITSDMVVAAIMNAGDKLDAEFQNTAMTFAQAWQKIKNAATKAFEPALDKLNELANSDAMKSFIDGVANGLLVLGKVMYWVIDAFNQFFTWSIENWSWFKYVVYGVVTALLTWFALLATKAMITGAKMFFSFLVGLSPLYLWIIIIGTIIGALVYLANVAKSTCDFIALLAQMVAMVVIGVIVGIVLAYMAGLTTIISATALTVLIIIAVVAILIMLIFSYMEQVTGAVWVALTWVGNLFQSLGNMIMAIILSIVAIVYNAVALTVNIVMAMVKTIVARATNIKIAFQNAWNGALEAFWSFIAGVLNGLKSIEAPINALAKLFGKGGFTVSGAAASASSKASGYASKQQSYVNVDDAFASGFNTIQYKSLSNAWNTGKTTFGTGLADYNWRDAYATGAAKGASWKNSINEFGSNLGSTIKGKINSGKSWLSDKLNIGSLPSSNNPAYDVSNSYNPDNLNTTADGGSGGGGSGKGGKGGSGKLKDIADDTSKIADALEMSEEDLKVFRDLANLEWKYEHTTTEIKVDMSNYNNINGETDLDGIVTKLTDKLYDELESLADGVYA